MGSFDTMKARMQSTGLYALDGTGAADWELQAYAAGIDPIREKLEMLKRESFVKTAEDLGLRNSELLCGLPDIADSDDARRKAVLAFGEVGPNSFTVSGFQDLLASLGITAKITEDVPDKKITVTIAKEEYGSDTHWQEVMGRFFPAHLTVEWHGPAT